jgi:hypothetical protein
MDGECRVTQTGAAPAADESRRSRFPGPGPPALLIKLYIYDHDCSHRARLAGPPRRCGLCRDPCQRHRRNRKFGSVSELEIEPAEGPAESLLERDATRVVRAVSPEPGLGPGYDTVLVAWPGPGIVTIRVGLLWSRCPMVPVAAPSRVRDSDSDSSIVTVTVTRLSPSRTSPGLTGSPGLLH